MSGNPGGGGDDESRPGPLRAQEQALDRLYVPPGSLRAQARGIQDSQVLLGHLTAQEHPLRWTVLEVNDGGLVVQGESWAFLEPPEARMLPLLGARWINGVL